MSLKMVKTEVTQFMKNKKQYWEEIDKDKEYIMNRMHPAAIIPGFVIGITVIVGCVFKIIMGW